MWTSGYFDNLNCFHEISIDGFILLVNGGVYGVVLHAI